MLNCRLLLPAQELSSGEWCAFRETNGSPLCLLTIHKLLIYNLNNQVFGVSKTIVIILTYIAFILLYVSLPNKSLLSFQDYQKIRYRSCFKGLYLTYVGCWLAKGKDVFFLHCLFWLLLYRQGFWAKPLIIFVLMFYIVYKIYGLLWHLCCGLLCMCAYVDIPCRKSFMLQCLMVQRIMHILTNCTSDFTCKVRNNVL